MNNLNPLYKYFFNVTLLVPVCSAQHEEGKEIVRNAKKVLLYSVIFINRETVKKVFMYGFIFIFYH